MTRRMFLVGCIIAGALIAGALIAGALIAGALIMGAPNIGATPVEPTVCSNVFGDAIPQPNGTCPPGWTDQPQPNISPQDRATGIANGTYCYHQPDAYYELCPTPEPQPPTTPTFTG